MAVFGEVERVLAVEVALVVARALGQNSLGHRLLKETVDLESDRC